MYNFLSLENETCYDLTLLILRSKTNKGLCVAASSVNDTTMTLTHITVRLFVNDINHQYIPNCGNVGSALLDSSYEFSCALNFNELEEVEFVISGYDPHKWTTVVRVTIAHHCTNSEGI